jgi:hypothetical protein
VPDVGDLDETLDLLSVPGTVEQIRAAEEQIAHGEAVDADTLHRLLAERAERERRD